MNQYSTPTVNEGLANVSGNSQNRSFGGNPQYNNSNPPGDPQVRMQQPNFRNPNFPYQQGNIQQQQQQPYQQQQQQQQQQPRNMYQQDPRPQQIGDSSLYQTNHAAYNNNFRPPMSSQNAANNNEFQRGVGNPPQMQRAQPVPQPRFSDVRPPAMPPMNGSSNAFKVDQPKDAPRFPNHQQMEGQKFQTPQNQMFATEHAPDSQKKSENANKTTEQFLTRKDSNLNLSQPQTTINQQAQPEAKVTATPIPQNISNTSNEKNSDLPESQQSVLPKLNYSKPDLSRSSTQDSVIEKAEKMSTDSQNKSNTKEKTKVGEKIKKESNKSKEESNGITSGLVHKNIKFFEENDTAKIPLRPQTLSIKRKERTESLSSDVVRGEYSECDSESGVDDTPMIHPNLKSIFQAPSKVAKLPTKSKKKFTGSRKSKFLHFSDEDVKQKKPGWKFSYKSSIKSTQNFSQHACRHGFGQKQKITKFKPEEELLSFFYNSHIVQKLKKEGKTKSDQNAAKDKVANKPTTNGDIVSPKKTPSKLPGPSKKTSAAFSPTKTPLKSPGTPGAKSLPKTPETPSPPTPLIKKVPMNKIQVGAAPSPNLKTVRSKVGSLVNTTHKPGGGNIRIESHKIDFSKAQPRIEAKNDQYAPSGGDKKITQVKLQWSAKSKVGSLENATYKPGGGDKKIESVKLDFKEKAKPKVGSKDNVKHVPGGGTVKIENQKLEFKAQSKVGSLDNVKHKPGGGDIKIFDDKTYLKQISGNSSEGRVSGTQSYGDLSVVREVVGRSAPGTPGRKTAVKIKRTTTIHTTGASPSVKNVTEVMVESQTPKKNKNIGKSPSKQQVKLTYSKFSSSIENGENYENKDSIEVVKVAAKDNAPVLKPSLGNKEALSSFEEERVTVSKRITTNFDNRESYKEPINLDVMKPSFESSDLLNDKSRTKIDSGSSKFFQDEIAAHEKVGEMWKERNSLEANAEKQWKEPSNQSLHVNNSGPAFGNQPHRPQNTTQFYEQRASNPKGNLTTQFSSISSNQNVIRPVSSQNIYQPTPFTQTQ